jgi:hypothetical protein
MRVVQARRDGGRPLRDPEVQLIVICLIMIPAVLRAPQPRIRACKYRQEDGILGVPASDQQYK